MDKSKIFRFLALIQIFYRNVGTSLLLWVMGWKWPTSHCIAHAVWKISVFATFLQIKLTMAEAVILVAFDTQNSYRILYFLWTHCENITYNDYLFSLYFSCKSKFMYFYKQSSLCSSIYLYDKFITDSV